MLEGIPFPMLKADHTLYTPVPIDGAPSRPPWMDGKAMNIYRYPKIIRPKLVLFFSAHHFKEYLPSLPFFCFIPAILNTSLLRKKNVEYSSQIPGHLTRGGKEKHQIPAFTFVKMRQPKRFHISFVIAFESPSRHITRPIPATTLFAYKEASLSLLLYSARH